MTDVYNIFSYIHSLNDECIDTTFEVEHVIYEGDEGYALLTDYKTLYLDTISDSQLPCPSEILYLICQYTLAKDNINLARCNKILNFRIDKNKLLRNGYLNDFNMKYDKDSEGCWESLYTQKLRQISQVPDKLAHVIANGYYRFIPVVLQSKDFMKVIQHDPIAYLNYTLDKPNYLETIMTLFDHNWDIPEHIDPLLLTATTRGKLDVCKYLVSKGANIEYKDDKNQNAIYVAVANGRTDVCKFLLDNGAEIDSIFNGATGLYWAARKGNDETLELLILRGADINFILTDPNNTDIKRTPVCSAIAGGNEECAKLLIKAGCNVNISSPEGSALYLAINGGYYELVQLILERNADQTIPHKEKTPLYLASEKGLDNIVDLLCQDSLVEIDKVYKKKTPLYIACESGHFNVAKVLIKHGANVNLSLDGATPLFVACMNNKVDIVELLCKNGAKFDVVDHTGTALDEIADDGCKRMIDLYKKVRVEIF